MPRCEDDWVVRGRHVVLVIPLRFRPFRMPPIICPLCYFLAWFRFHEEQKDEHHVYIGSPVIGLIFTPPIWGAAIG